MRIATGMARFAHEHGAKIVVAVIVAVLTVPITLALSHLETRRGDRIDQERFAGRMRVLREDLEPYRFICERLALPDDEPYLAGSPEGVPQDRHMIPLLLAGLDSLRAYPVVLRESLDQLAERLPWVYRNARRWQPRIRVMLPAVLSPDSLLTVDSLKRQTQRMWRVVPPPVLRDYSGPYLGINEMAPYGSLFNPTIAYTLRTALRMPCWTLRDLVEAVDSVAYLGRAGR